ncbi:MAG: sugar ABC transporter permease [Anaerolineales bacterium]|nr:sugar ABC transporter permease [Anaerolineales bacterium]
MHINKDRLFSILFISPSILAIAIFVYGFIGWSVKVSFSAWQGLLPDYTWVGLENYTELFHDRRFMIDLRNTAIFTVLFLAACLIFGLLLALLLDRTRKGANIFRNIFLFPMAVSFIVTGVAWRWLMNPATGTRMSGLNLLFDRLGLDFLISNWHTTPDWGIAFIVIPAVWQMSGFTMALYLSGIQSIPLELREAAMVDGANELQTFRHIILPLLRPITLSAVIILGHTSLKIFDLIVAISGKDIRLDVPAIYMWTTSFDANNFARGATIGIIMLITVAIVIVPYLVFGTREETEL